MMQGLFIFVKLKVQHFLYALILANTPLYKIYVVVQGKQWRGKCPRRCHSPDCYAMRRSFLRSHQSAKPHTPARANISPAST